LAHSSLFLYHFQSRKSSLGLPPSGLVKGASYTFYSRGWAMGPASHYWSDLCTLGVKIRHAA